MGWTNIYGLTQVYISIQATRIMLGLRYFLIKFFSKSYVLLINNQMPKSDKKPQYLEILNKLSIIGFSL